MDRDECDELVSKIEELTGLVLDPWQRRVLVDHIEAAAEIGEW